MTREVKLRSKRAVSLAVLAGLCLLIAGCGNAHNPVRISSIHVPQFLSGMWDGFTIVIGFIAHLINRTKYDFIAHHFGVWYFIGWLIGVALFLAVFGGWPIFRRRVVRVR